MVRQNSMFISLHIDPRFHNPFNSNPLFGDLMLVDLKETMDTKFTMKPQDQAYNKGKQKLQWLIKCMDHIKIHSPT